MDELKKVKTTYILERREYLLVSVTETKPHSYATLSIPPSNSDFVEKKYENRYSANSICPYSIPLHQNQYMFIYPISINQPKAGCNCNNEWLDAKFLH